MGYESKNSVQLRYERKSSFYNATMNFYMTFSLYRVPKISKQQEKVRENLF